MSLSPGDRLGRYEIRASLGEGGMGQVYLAYDPTLERDVAVKVLHGDRDESPDRIRRFVQEAKAASSLNHPNVATVYEIGTADDLRFIAMEVVEGETLRTRLSRGSLPFDDVLSIGTQMAAALAEAHKRGIVHRDVKPENVIVRPDGYAKVLDFGLAKLNRSRSGEAETLMRTQSGVVMGTLRYMAPEQFGGSDVTPAADVFSLGVVLYEMAAGRRPFDGNTPTAVATAILTKPPAPISGIRSDVPPRLASIIRKALEKSPDDRYADAGALLEDLKQISRENVLAGGLDAVQRRRSRTLRRAALAGAAVLVIAAIAAGGWMLRRSQRLEAARAALAQAEKLLEQRAFPETFEMASIAAQTLPNDERVRTLLARTSTRVSFESDPPGATVFLERFKGKPGRVNAGVTPLVVEQLPRADYIVTFVKDGFLPAARPLSRAPFFLGEHEVRIPSDDVRVRLLDARRGEPDMVFVEGAPYRLAGWSRPSDRQIELSDFLIDRHEVSNGEFEKFVRAGGYRRREWWRHPFVLDGRTLSFEEAMARFRDTTGLPGPRGWVGGAPPAGRQNYPVTGVTWHEAAAYAHWKGRTLPTIFQWEKAARWQMRGAVGSALPWGVVLEGVDATERANFGGKGAMPVDSMPFGMSPWGALHMAGNVAEWCLNEREPGAVVRGGGWDDAVYTFGRTGSFPKFYASDTLGFRCARQLTPGGEAGSFALSPSATVPEFKPVDDREYETLRRQYDYAKTPLEARIVETVDTPEWRREKIVYRVNGTEVPAYLYIPKGFSGPLQVIHFSPAGDVAVGNRALPASIEDRLAPFIRDGRALFSVVLEGFLGRPSTEDPGLDSRSAQYVDFVIRQVTELRRGLDYLETRKDLDPSRIAFIGPSAGSWAGVILTAVEPRYRSVMFIGTDIHAREITDAPAANRINFAPRIAAPKLMLQGRYDESAPLDTEAMPLFRLLREPKRFEVFEGSHVPPMSVAVPITTKWLDETLGPVASR